MHTSFMFVYLFASSVTGEHRTVDVLIGFEVPLMNDVTILYSMLQFYSSLPCVKYTYVYLSRVRRETQEVFCNQLKTK